MAEPSINPFPDGWRPFTRRRTPEDGCFSCGRTDVAVRENLLCDDCQPAADVEIRA